MAKSADETIDWGTEALTGDELCVHCSDSGSGCPGADCQRRQDFIAGAKAVREALRPWWGRVGENFSTEPGHTRSHVISVQAALDHIVPEGLV